MLKEVLLSQNYEINLARFSDNFNLHPHYDGAMNNKCVTKMMSVTHQNRSYARFENGCTNVIAR